MSLSASDLHSSPHRKKVSLLNALAVALFRPHTNGKVVLVVRIQRRETRHHVRVIELQKGFERKLNFDVSNAGVCKELYHKVFA